MRIDVGSSDLSAIMQEIEGDIAGAASEAMRETTLIAKQELREQVTGAGLGVRLANTWRSESYPRNRNSVTPAGYIWSNAPDIIDSFSRGATIVPLAGRRYLAIPTKNVPRARKRNDRSFGKLRGGAMTPAEVEVVFNQDLFFKRGRAGRVLAFINAVTARNGRGARNGTQRRLAQGRELKPILMFVLVPSTRLPKVLDLDVVAQRWAARFEAAFTARIGR